MFDCLMSSDYDVCRSCRWATIVYDDYDVCLTTVSADYDVPYDYLLYKYIHMRVNDAPPRIIRPSHRQAVTSTRLITKSSIDNPYNFC